MGNNRPTRKSCREDTPFYREEILWYCAKKKSNRAEPFGFGAISFDFGAIRFRFGAIRFRFGAIRFCLYLMCFLRVRALLLNDFPVVVDVDLSFGRCLCGSALEVIVGLRFEV